MKKLATFELDAMNPALTVGAPWYASGAQRWNGAAATLNPNPMATMMIAMRTSGSREGPLIAAAICGSLIEPETPYNRLMPNRRNPADMPPKRKYFRPASADWRLCLSKPVRMRSEEHTSELQSL